MLNLAQTPTNSVSTMTKTDCRGIAIPACQSMITRSVAYADGFQSGQDQCESQDEEHWYLLTDTQFTERILRSIPKRWLRVDADADEWRRGFIFGWTLAFYHRPMHNEGLCDAIDAVVQRVTILGSWALVETKRERYLHQFADCLEVEFPEWGKTAKQGRSYIVVEWLGEANAAFRAFLEQIQRDESVEEVVVYEVPAPRCVKCLPRINWMVYDPLPNLSTTKAGASHV